MNQIRERDLRSGNQIRNLFRIGNFSNTQRRKIRIGLRGCHIDGRTKIGKLASSIVFFTSEPVTIIRGKAQFPRALGEAKIRIVLAKQDTILRPRSKHAIGFIHALRDQIIYQNTYIRLITTENERFLIMTLKMSIDPGHDTLSSRFLISGRTIDLSRQKEVFNLLQFKVGFQLCRIKIVIFYSISRAEYLDIFQTLDLMQRLQLNIERKRRGKTLQIILVGVSPFRFEEKLMMIVIGKYTKFVFDARTITRTPAADQPIEKRGILEPASKGFMNGRIGMQDETLHLRSTVLDGGTEGKKRKLTRRRITVLTEKMLRVNRGNINPRGSTGFHPGSPDPKRGELFGKAVGSEFTDTTPFKHRPTDKKLAAQESSGSQDNCLRFENRARRRTDAQDFSVFKKKTSYSILVNI